MRTRDDAENAVMADDALPRSIDLALNEATWWGITLDRPRNRIALGFDVFTLPEGPDGSGRARVTVVLGDVHRFVVSMRNGRWDDDEATVEPCTEDELTSIHRSFGGSPVYGYDFFDLDDDSWRRWATRLSLDSAWLSGDALHSINLFQEHTRENRILDFRGWFDDLVVVDTDQQVIPVDAFAAGGQRWWEGFNSGDPRTEGFGMFPLKNSTDDAHETP
jgi:hypothetical protein